MYFCKESPPFDSLILVRIMHLTFVIIIWTICIGCQRQTLVHIW